MSRDLGEEDASIRSPGQRQPIMIMDAAGSSCAGVGYSRAYYEKLPDPGSSTPSRPMTIPVAPRRRDAPKRRAASSAPRKQIDGRRFWVVAVRWAVVRVVAGVTRRRPCIQPWAAKLWGRLRRAVGMVSAVAVLPPAAPAAYDLAGYFRNFDDGAWREEDEDFWRGGGSFAFRFSKSGRYARDGTGSGLASGEIV